MIALIPSYTSWSNGFGIGNGGKWRRAEGKRQLKQGSQSDWSWLSSYLHQGWSFEFVDNYVLAALSVSINDDTSAKSASALLFRILERQH